MKKIVYVLLLCLLYPAGILQAWNGKVLISTPRSSILLNTWGEGQQLQFAYFGDRINENQIDQVFDSWNGLSRPAYPVFGTSSYESSALQVVHADGNLTLDLIVDKVETLDEKSAKLTVIHLKDRVYPFYVTLNFRAFNNLDIIETWTEYSHNEKKAVVLKRFDSGHFMIRRGDVWISSLSGHWGTETRITTEPLTSGMKVIKNMDGVRNGLGEHSEVMFSLDGKPQENSGRVIGAVLCWGGRTKIRIDSDDTYGSHVHHVFAGMNEEASEYKLEPREVFTTPKLALTYSCEGLGEASRNLHRWARMGMVYSCDKPRDILLNSWEGVYLNIKEQEMDQMMKDFAAMGGELFVMDDGWFGNKYRRIQDNSSLGDWVVDTQKLPHGIKGLTDTATASSLQTGAWHHVALVHDGVAKSTELFVDGGSAGKVAVFPKLPFMNAYFNMYLGTELRGKLDETFFSMLPMSAAEINAVKTDGLNFNNWNHTKVQAYWKYDEEQNPGKDSHSWVTIMENIRQKLVGKDIKFRLGVSGGDWAAMIGNANNRTSFAKNIKTVLDKYQLDGVDLDFEWASTTDQFTNYSLTIQEIRKVIGSDYLFTVSLHPISYKITSQAVAVCDWISFQCYGPKATEFPYENYTSHLQAAVNYGIPAEKLVPGLPFYGTKNWNSGGSEGTAAYFDMVKEGSVKNTIDDQVIHKGTTYYLNSVSTIQKKVRYALDRYMHGVMSWDLATDCDYDNSLSLQRAVVNEIKK